MIKDILLNKIVPSHVMLRPVREDTVEFLEMVDSIRDSGILNSIAVRQHPSREGLFEIIDGMWRYTCCKLLNFLDIPCIIIENVTDEQLLYLQLEANAISYATRPIEYAHQLIRTMKLREEVGAPLTLVALAGLVHKSTSWIKSRLCLLKLHEDLQDEIREGTMGLGVGVALSRINKHKHQLQVWQDNKGKKTRDIELAVGTFIQKVIADLDKKKDDKRELPILQPRLQSMDTLLIELDRMEELSQIIVQRGLTTAIEGAKLAIEWTLHLHEEGRQAQVRELRYRLREDERREIIGRQQYEDLKDLRKLREERNDFERESFE